MAYKVYSGVIPNCMGLKGEMYTMILLRQNCPGLNWLPRAYGFRLAENKIAYIDASEEGRLSCYGPPLRLLNCLFRR